MSLLHQERTQVVYSNREARKFPTESNGTQTGDLLFEDIRIRRWTQQAYTDGPKNCLFLRIRNAQPHIGIFSLNSCVWHKGSLCY